MNEDFSRDATLGICGIRIGSSTQLGSQSPYLWLSSKGRGELASLGAHGSMSV